MAEINVALGNNAYTVTIQAGLFARAAEYLQAYAMQGRLCIVTDSQVASYYSNPLAEILSKHGITAHFYKLPVGEQAKSWSELEKLIDWLIEKDVTRKDSIIALGGGVVGDITGFASAIVKRGCKFVQIPTTLLAQVDSSVGGKTAINTATGKNLVGAFHQPSAVYIDPEMLSTLPDRHIRAGYAEVIKYGLINDAAFFAWCEANGTALLSRDPDALQYAIAYCIKAKADIVSRDERETANIRALLNLGHTFGHALEAETGFGERLYHGEAVALGMVIAHKLSAELGFCPPDDASRVAQHVGASRLPAKLSSLKINCSGERFFEHMMHDKKRIGGTLPFILTKGIGKAFYADDISRKSVIEFLDQLV